MSADINTIWGSWIIEELCRLGSQYFCIGAGSRSTPLTNAAANNDKAITKVFVDERSAAFYALGVAKASDRPAVVITTSGTAMANALPAVIEARKSQTPLILISADRPPELQESGANQTIDQVKMFGRHVIDYIGLPCPSAEVRAHYLLGRINHAFQVSIGYPRGPVHINAPFRKPLGPSPTNDMSPWPDDGPWMTRHPISMEMGKEGLMALSKFIDKKPGGIIIIGTLNSARERDAAKQIIAESPWPSFIDISAGFQSTDALPMTLLQSSQGRAALKDRVVLHLGGNMVSTGAARTIEMAPECLQINPQKGNLEPESKNKSVIQASISSIPSLKWPWEEKLKLHCRRLQNNIETALEISMSDALTEMSMVFHLSKLLDSEVCSFWSNSMPVRDANAFVKWKHSDVAIGTNRGASGIDGIIASAAGFQAAHNKPCIVTIGDLAAWHDLSSLMHLAAFRQPLLLIVPNNGGGGIFSFLPISKESDAFESHFAVAHNMRFAELSKAMGMECNQPDSIHSFIEMIKDFIASPRLMVIELYFKRDENVKQHDTVNRIIDDIVQGGI